MTGQGGGGGYFSVLVFLPPFKPAAGWAAHLQLPLSCTDVGVLEGCACQLLL